MKIEKEEHIEITIKLNELEAGFLKRAIQNVNNPYRPEASIHQKHDDFFKQLFNNLPSI